MHGNHLIQTDEPGESRASAYPNDIVVNHELMQEGVVLSDISLMQGHLLGAHLHIHALHQGGGNGGRGWVQELRPSIYIQQGGARW
jgi:hypothetical protein